MSDEKDLYNVSLSPEDVRRAGQNVVIEADPSIREPVRGVVGTGNIILDNYMQNTEGVTTTDILNSHTVRVPDNLGGALGTYEPTGRNAGRISLLKKYAYSPLHALSVYVHEATHKALDKVFGYERKLMNYTQEVFEVNPILGLLTMQYGNALNEGLTDAVRLKTVGENGIVSTYQRNGFIGAAMYALNRSGGKIRNLVNRLPEAINDFVTALASTRSAYNAA